MHFYTHDECQEWLTARGRELPREGGGLAWKGARIPYQAPALQAFAQAVTDHLMRARGQRVLFWVTRGAEDLDRSRLYHRLRQRHGDFRHCAAAPGHLALPYEIDHLASLLFLAMATMCEGYLLGESDRVSAFLTDEWYIDFFAQRDEDLGFVEALRGA